MLIAVKRTNLRFEIKDLNKLRVRFINKTEFLVRFVLNVAKY